MDYRELTPADAGLASMISSLTGQEVQPQVNEDDTYTLTVPLTDDKEKNGAILRAVEGKAGKRLVRTLMTVPGNAAVVTIRKSDEKLPSYAEALEYKKEYPQTGQVYCKRLDECRALQVFRGNIQQLVLFVGCGQMEAPEEGPATFHFLNANQSVWAHAKEGDYIVYERPGHFRIVPEEEFEQVWERK